MTPIQAIKAAVRCDAYVSRYLEVRNNKAICPFHHEKTASFSLKSANAHCFGCGWSGDVIKFAAEYHGISTAQAVKELADELGIRLTRQPQVHPYEEIKRQRIRTEAIELRRLTRRQMVECTDYNTSLPFLEDLDAMTPSQFLDYYLDQRTPEPASFLRHSAALAAAPTVESLVKEFLQWSR